MLMLADGSFVVTPSPWVMAWVLVFTLAGVVTMAKGRWGWLLVGLLLGGITWPLSALMRATPGSVWERASSRMAGRRSSSAQAL